MRPGRDSAVLFLTLAPAMVFVVMFLSWRNQTVPFFGPMLSGLSGPSINPPTLPEIALPLPPIVVEYWHRLASNGQTMALAIGGGAIVGIIGVGALADLVRSLARFISGPAVPQEPADIPEHHSAAGADIS